MISALCASRFFRLWWKTSQKTRKRRRNNRRKHVICGHSRQRNSGSLGETLEGKGGGFLSTPLWSFLGDPQHICKRHGQSGWKKHVLILFVSFCYGDFGCGEMPMVEFGNGFGFSKRWLNRWTSTWLFKGMSAIFWTFLLSTLLVVLQEKGSPCQHPLLLLSQFCIFVFFCWFLFFLAFAAYCL